MFFPTHEITMIGISEQVNCNDLKLGWKWRLVWKVDGYRLQGKPHRSNPTHLYKSNTYIIVTMTWFPSLSYQRNIMSLFPRSIWKKTNLEVCICCVINMTFIDMLGLFRGLDNVHGFKSFSRFANEKMKNFSPVNSIDPMLPYRLYVFHANQNITPPTLIFLRAHIIAVRIGYNFS